MFKVEIVYKSGKKEIAEIEIGKYTQAMVQLGEEGNLVRLKIIEVI